MPISYKNKIYTTLGTPTDLSGSVVSATDSAGVPAKDYTVKGKTIVWNQLFTNSATSSNGVNISQNQDGTMTLNGTANVSWINFTNLSDAMNQVHKYLLCLKILNNPDNVPFHYGWLNRDWMRTDIISNGENCTIVDQTETLTQRGKSNGLSGFTAGTVFNNVKVAVMVMDLTQMFGVGNEPATPEEFRAMFPDYYYSYNAGELKTIVPTSIEASGINLLNLVGRKEISSDIVGYRYPTDAYPEIDTHIYYRGISANGYLSSGNIVEATVLSSSVIAKTGTNPGSPGYGVGIPLTVVPSTTYYIKCTTSGVISIGYANSNKIITKFTGELSGPNIAITTPEDCRYALIVFRPNALDTLATFENICVSAVQTNEYQPYHKYRVNIPSSKYFPDGMRSAGSAYDEINFLSQKAIKRIGAVDMSEVNWSSNTGTYPTNSFYSSGFTAAKGNSTNIISNTSFKQLYANSEGLIIVLTYDNEVYDSSEAFKAAMSGVMLYYELKTPVETAITPPLQALPTYKGFTSFSAPNSLTQNGPLSVTYYAEGGANPEKGWLTSYKRKLYMGRTIEWNQLLDKSKYPTTATANGVTFTNNGDGTITVNGTAGSTASFSVQSNYASIVSDHKYLVLGCPKGGTNSTYSIRYNANGFGENGSGKIVSKGDSIEEHNYTRSLIIIVGKGVTCSNLVFKPQLFDLTQMFGAGNEPTTPEEFWSYFDHKLYPYNAGETQPLFKISRKSQWGGNI